MGDLCNVLIVDDEQLVRQGIKHFVNWEQEGFRIVGEAANGKEALELIEKFRPHIVITDIVMPLMDGEELTRKVKTLYPEIEVIVLSSFGEFDYVRSSFQSGVADYILKPKLEAQALLTVLKSAARKIPTLRMPRADKDRTVSIDDVIEKQIAGFDSAFDPETVTAAFPYDSFCLVSADLRMLNAQEEHRPEIGRELGRLLEAELQAAGGEAVCHSVPGDQGRLIFLINMDRKRITALEQALARAAERSAEYDPAIGWLAAEPFTAFNQLGRTYREGFARLLQLRYYFPDRTLLLAKDATDPAPNQPVFDLNRFTEELKRQQFDSAFTELREHAEAVSRAGAVDVFEFRSFLGNIIFNVTVMLGNLGFETKELEEGKYAFFKAVEEAKTAQEAISRLDAFIQQAELAIAARNQDTAGANMRKLLDFIEEHYAEPLTLTDAAKHFHFNPSYLSSYFSAHNKEGFNEYVNKIRIGKATELLRAGAAPIAEISSMVGYSDHSYFCRVFKKATGLAPSQYRRKFYTP